MIENQAILPGFFYIGEKMNVLVVFSFKTGAKTSGYYDFQDSGWPESGENDGESGELENRLYYFQFSRAKSFLLEQKKAPANDR